jgi:hypothetical protein
MFGSSWSWCIVLALSLRPPGSRLGCLSIYEGVRSSGFPLFRKDFPLYGRFAVKLENVIECRVSPG